MTGGQGGRRQAEWQAGSQPASAHTCGWMGVSLTTPHTQQGIQKEGVHVHPVNPVNEVGPSSLDLAAHLNM